MEEHEQKEFERLKKLADELDRHPATKQQREKEAAETLSKRTAAAAKIEALRKEQADSLPKLQADIDGKEAKFKKAKAALDVAGGEWNAARAALSSENYQRSNEISQQEAILYESADPLIDETIQFFRAKIDDLRKPGRISSRGMNIEKNLFTDRKKITVETNEGAVLGAIQFCREAIKGLEALKLSPEFHIELMQELKDALPSIEVYQEVTGEKPTENSKGRSFASYFKSEDQSNFEVSKLLKKADKLLSGKSARA